MFRFVTAFGVFTCFAGLAHGQAANNDGPLPVKRVVLYKNGVGYFEHVGSHGMIPSDWDVFLKFMEMHLKP